MFRSPGQKITGWLFPLGGAHTTALKSDETLWTWGVNGSGQLGDGSDITNRNVPGQIYGGGNTWAAVSAGFAHTAALKSDGTLWTWGFNYDGQLGDGSNTNRNTPTQVSGGRKAWVAVSAGAMHTVALKSDGTLWTWGNNDFGQLGNGNFRARRGPRQVSGGGHTWAAVAAGWGHTAALKSDGTLWIWGDNASGQLGDGSNTNRNTPVQVSGGENTWVAVAAGGNHTVALKLDGTLWGWGWNDTGQLGDGSYTDRNIPVQVSGGRKRLGGCFRWVG